MMTRTARVARWRASPEAIGRALRSAFDPSALGALVRKGWLDALGLLVAFAYGLPTLWYRFGRDQAIFYYIGREWLAGRIPYRDAFDVKPPAIYAVHALAIALLGPHESSIRALELLAVCGGGALVALSVQRKGPRRPGEIGICAMLFSSFYFTLFDFWDTGQVEIWEGLFLLASYAAVERTERWKRGALVGGALGGLAVMFKFTAGLAGLFLGCVAFLRAAQRAPAGTPWHERVARGSAAIALYGLAAAAIVAGFLAYFAAHHALHAVTEWAAYVRSYAKNNWQPSSPLDEAKWFSGRGGLWGGAFLAGWFIALVEASARKARSAFAGAWIAVCLFGLSVAGIAAQRKWFSYHWGVIVPFIVLMAAYGVAEIARLNARMAVLGTMCFVATGFWLAPSWPTNASLTYRTYTTDQWWPLVDDGAPFTLFLRSFSGMTNFSYANQYTIGQEILKREHPGDLMVVRGFEVGMYNIAGLRAPSRFASDLPVEEGPEEYRRAWATEHNNAVWGSRPRFFVGFSDRDADVHDIVGHGYHELTRAGLFVLFERNPPGYQPPAAPSTPTAHAAPAPSTRPPPTNVAHPRAATSDAGARPAHAHHP